LVLREARRLLSHGLAAVPYKKIDLLVDAFAKLPDKQLVVIGDGPEVNKLRAKAGRNVRLLGYQDASVLCDHIQRARAFLFASREDFGIVLVEAQAAGTPVIAFGQGGALETIRGLEADKPTGVLFEEQSAEAVVDAIRTFERQQHRIKAADCRENAARFGIERFHQEFYQHAMQQWDLFQSGSLSDEFMDVAEDFAPGASSIQPLRAA